MARLINLDEAKKRAVKVTIYDEGGWDMTCKAVPVEELDKLPTIEVEPVRHGRWIEIIEFDYNCSPCGCHYKCSICNEIEYDTTAFCPNCGAKMDKEEA